jgi:hypothetical protein
MSAPVSQKPLPSPAQPSHIIPQEKIATCPACMKITEKCVKIILSGKDRYYICSQDCFKKILAGRVYVVKPTGEVVQVGFAP